MGLLSLLRLARDKAGQDLVDYALIAGFLALFAGAVLPGVAAILGKIFGDISSAILTWLPSGART